MPRVTGSASRGASPVNALRPAVPILMYHEISSDVDPGFQKYVVRPNMFARQMRWLARAGYTPVGLSALHANRSAAVALPERPVVITFDDGYRDCVRWAGSILQERGFRGVVFAVAGLVGQPSRWLLRERGLARPLAGWAELRALVQIGFELGAHSVTHPRLATLEREAVRREAEVSRRVLEDGLGQEVAHFAYPFGSVDATVRAVVAEAGYQTACTTRIGISPGDDDPLMLSRVPVTGHDTLMDFACRLQTAATVTQAARAAARRCWTSLQSRLG